MASWRRAAFIGLFFLAAATTGHAQDYQAGSAGEGGDEPGFYPGLTAEWVHDDNIFRRRDEISDQIWRLGPSLVFRKPFGKHTLDLSYNGDYAWYRDYDELDYMDHDLNASFQLDLSRKLDGTLEAGYEWGHDRPGALGTRPVLIGDVDEWEMRHFLGEVIYGRRTTRAQIALSGEHRELRYTNNNQDFRDRDSDELVATIYYNLSGKTSLLAEAGWEEIDYLDPGVVNLDSTEQRFRVGGRWSATAKTTGEVKFGWMEKDLEDPTLNDFSGTSLEARVAWQPQTYNELQLEAVRETQESVLAGTSYYLSERIGVDYRHEFSPRWLLNTGANWQRAEFSDGSEDDIFDFSIGLDYAFRRWLRFGVGYDYQERDSSITAFDYEANIFSIGVALVREGGGE